MFDKDIFAILLCVSQISYPFFWGFFSNNFCFYDENKYILQLSFYLLLIGEGLSNPLKNSIANKLGYHNMLVLSLIIIGVLFEITSYAVKNETLMSITFITTGFFSAVIIESSLVQIFKNSLQEGNLNMSSNDINYYARFIIIAIVICPVLQNVQIFIQEALISPDLLTTDYYLFYYGILLLVVAFYCPLFFVDETGTKNTFLGCLKTSSNKSETTPKNLDDIGNENKPIIDEIKKEMVLYGFYFCETKKNMIIQENYIQMQELIENSEKVATFNRKESPYYKEPDELLTILEASQTQECSTVFRDSTINKLAMKPNQVSMTPQKKSKTKIRSSKTYEEKQIIDKSIDPDEQKHGEIQNLNPYGIKTKGQYGHRLKKYGFNHSTSQIEKKDYSKKLTLEIDNFSASSDSIKMIIENDFEDSDTDKMSIDEFPIKKMISVEVESTDSGHIKMHTMNDLENINDKNQNKFVNDNSNQPNSPFKNTQKINKLATINNQTNKILENTTTFINKEDCPHITPNTKELTKKDTMNSNFSRGDTFNGKFSKKGTFEKKLTDCSCFSGFGEEIEFTQEVEKKNIEDGLNEIEQENLENQYPIQKNDSGNNSYKENVNLAEKVSLPEFKDQILTQQNDLEKCTVTSKIKVNDLKFMALFISFTINYGCSWPIINTFSSKVLKNKGIQLSITASVVGLLLVYIKAKYLDKCDMMKSVFFTQMISITGIFLVILCSYFEPQVYLGLAIIFSVVVHNYYVSIECVSRIYKEVGDYLPIYEKIKYSLVASQPIIAFQDFAIINFGTLNIILIYALLLSINIIFLIIGIYVESIYKEV